MNETARDLKIRKRSSSLQVRKIGNSDRLHPAEGDCWRGSISRRATTVYLVEQPDGGLRLTPVSTRSFERTMEIAREVMDKYRDTLAALAK